MITKKAVWIQSQITFCFYKFTYYNLWVQWEFILILYFIGIMSFLLFLNFVCVFKTCFLCYLDVITHLGISPPEIIRSNFPRYARCEGTLSMIAFNPYSNENKDVLNLIQPDWIQEPRNSRPIMYKNMKPKQDFRNWRLFIRNSGTCCWKLYSRYA